MNQRQLHQEGLLVPGRVHKLEAIPGWTWSTKLEAMWEAQLERLKKVALRLKRLPSCTEEDSEAQEAGKFIANQRQLHWEGILEPDRAIESEAISGWSWNAYDTKWAAQVSNLKQVMQANQNTVPSRYDESNAKAEQQAAYFAKNQRRAKNTNTLSDACRQELDSIVGWDWGEGTSVGKVLIKKPSAKKPAKTKKSVGKALLKKPSAKTPIKTKK